MDIIGAISTLSAAAKAAKDLKEVHALISDAEAKLKLATIIEAFADAKIALSEAKEKISELEREKKDSEIKTEKIDKLKRKGVLYFDDAERLFKCPTCIEKHQLIITLTPNRYENAFSYKCQNCSSTFASPEWRERN